MAKTPRHILVIELRRSSLRAAEMAVDPSAQPGPAIELAAEPGEAWSVDAALGRRLATQIKKAGLKARRAVVGVPGTWVLARRWDLPPVPEAQLAGIVRLRTEKDFASPAPLAFDFVPAPSEGEQRGVLVVGLRRDRLDGIAAMLQAAGLETAQITPLAAAAANPSGRTLVLEDGSATLIGRSNGQAYGLTSATVGEAPARWTADVTRLQASLHPPAEITPGPLELVDLAGDRPQWVEHLNESMPQLQTTRADGLTRLGRAHAAADDQAIDWSADRLKPPAPKRWSRTVAWSVRAAALVLLVALVGAYFWHEASSRVDELQQEYDLVSPQAAQLEQMHERTRDAADWFDQRLPVMDCLLELTRTFPQRGRIWVTQFTLSDDRGGVVRCQAENKDTMLAYLNAMQQSPSLDAIELRDWNETGRDERTVVFEIVFKYRPATAGGRA